MVGLIAHCTARYISRYTTRYTTPHPIWWYTTPHHTHHMPSLIKGWRGANGGGLLHQRSRLHPTIPDYTQIISPLGMRPPLIMQDGIKCYKIQSRVCIVDSLALSVSWLTCRGFLIRTVGVVQGCLSSVPPRLLVNRPNVIRCLQSTKSTEQ